MSGLARLLPYALAFTSSLCIMILELVSSRLVAPHVGASLTVWTSVIGIILGGICLGNVLGGRLADRVEPRRAVGPLFALGSFLTLCSLWINAQIGPDPPVARADELGAADGPRGHARLPDPGDRAGDGRAGRRQDGRRAGAEGRQRDRRRLFLGRDRLDRRDVPLRLRPACTWRRPRPSSSWSPRRWRCWPPP